VGMNEVLFQLSVCLYFCLFVYPLDRRKSYEQILMKFFSRGEVGHGPRNGQSDFGGDLCHNPDPGFLVSLLTIAYPRQSHNIGNLVQGEHP